MKTCGGGDDNMFAIKIQNELYSAHDNEFTAVYNKYALEKSGFFFSSS
jgi:hypothetical protein